MFILIADILAYIIVPYLEDIDIKILFTLSKDIRQSLQNRINLNHKIIIGNESEFLSVLNMINYRYNKTLKLKEKFNHKFALIMLNNTYIVPSYYKFLYDRFVSEMYIMYKMDFPLPKYIKKLGFDYTADSLVQDLVEYKELESLDIDISFQNKLNLPRNIKYLRMTTSSYAYQQNKNYIYYLIPPSIIELDISCCPSLILFDSQIEYNIKVLKVGFRVVEIPNNVVIDLLLFPSRVFDYLDTESLENYISWINNLNTFKINEYNNRNSPIFFKQKYNIDLNKIIKL